MVLCHVVSVNPVWSGDATAPIVSEDLIFAERDGMVAVLTYRVHFANPGRYYVWVRAYSTGSEDNGLHVGINGTWPASGQRMQWCDGKNSWRWDSMQRTAAQHCGEPYKIFLDVPTAGIHEVHFSMREDGFEFDRWLMTQDREFQRPVGIGPKVHIHEGEMPKAFPFVKPISVAAKVPDPVVDSTVDIPLQQPRQADGDGMRWISGELKQWHKISLTLNGPFANELDNDPNPFVDYAMSVRFTHASGAPSYVVPGYFAADGNAANTSAKSGTKWRAHLSPDQAGTWNYEISFRRGKFAALDTGASSDAVAGFDGLTGTFDVQATDKTGRDLRGRGRLQYVGQRYLKFAGTGEYFLKAGADAPETLLGYADFDGTIAGKPTKAPLKTWAPHVKDWNAGDSTWLDGKGKGLIGAINYLSDKGCNAFSFLTYNAGGDGDNVWPFVDRNNKLHYDCSKLDQWAMVFDHGTAKGMYLHFKLQETENDDNRLGPKRNEGKVVSESLDGGQLGVERKLYCRELIARYAHNLALNWNLGEENTQSTAEQKAMIDYIASLDPYHHNIVLHTFPEQQDAVYGPLLGDQSGLTGVSLQNSAISDTHWQVVKWVRESMDAGKPWVVAFDESGTAAHGQCPDLGYQGFDGRDKTGKMIYTEHLVRRQTLWGALMGGSAGVEYYFGYQFAENDLLCEDWRSRDRSWDYCRIALDFFRDKQIPFASMQPTDELVSANEKDNARYCLSETGKIYLVYIAEGDETTLDLAGVNGMFDVTWFNPRSGGPLTSGTVQRVTGGQKIGLGNPPTDIDEDWLAVVRRAE
jgi:hypothetical protein